MVFPAAVRRGQGLAVDHGDHLLDAGLDAAVVVAQLEMRLDGLVQDAVGGRVRQGTLQAVADLDAHASVVLGDDQYRAIVDTLAPELPLVRDTNAVLLDVLRLSGGDDQDGDLAAFLRLEIGQFALELVDRSPGKGSGEIDDPSRERRNGHVPAREKHGEAKACSSGGSATALPRAHAGGQCEGAAAGGDGAAAGGGAGGAGEKSTVGALEIAASFSTVKLGFGL
jgi:hypothetical protein